MSELLLKCSQCGTSHRAGLFTCPKCGNMLFDPKSSTVHMRIDPALLRLRRKRAQTDESPVPERVVMLQIRGLPEKLIFEESTEIILGRVDLTQMMFDRFDLTPFGGHERGVSREHVLLRFEDNQLTVTDLNSVNGTSVNSVKLEPNQTVPLKSGDELLLGSLPIIVRFDATPSGSISQAAPESKPNEIAS